MLRKSQDAEVAKNRIVQPKKISTPITGPPHSIKLPLWLSLVIPQLLMLPAQLILLAAAAGVVAFVATNFLLVLDSTQTTKNVRKYVGNARLN